MKKIIALLLSCLLLTACSSKPAETTLPSKTAAPSEIVTENQDAMTEGVGYILNVHAPASYYFEEADPSTFATVPITIDELDANLILDMLKEYSALNDDIQLNRLEIEGSQLNLDFNQAFLDQLLTYGTTGEKTFIGSVVNTFLSVYKADTVYITVNGEIMESGHVVYDFPMEFFE